MPNKNYHILIVDDDAEFHQQIRYAFRRNYVFEGAINIDNFEKKLKERSDYDLILLDLMLDDTDEMVGLELIPDISKRYPNIPIIVVTSENKIDVVVKAMKKGARDFLSKSDYDFDYWNKKFQEVIESKTLREENIILRQEVQKHRDQKQKEFTFVGESSKVQEIKRILRLVSEEPDITVLITGETGVGKEVAARFLHLNGARKDKPFQAVNLSAIQKTLLESTLFGHKKGAFTGATRDMEGYFNQANNGILMLDEIGDIDANIQIKLLRFLETKMIRPVGADKDIQLDVQIVAATHRDLKEEVEKGSFRADLYQRLKAMVVKIPSLRERKPDIPLILQHYYPEVDIKQMISPSAMDKLINYRWPGNIRELKNAISYMQLRRKIFDKNQIDLECLPVEIQEFDELSYDMGSAAPPEPPPLAANQIPANLSIEEEHALIDLRKIEQSLIRKNKVKKDVATELGLENTDNLRYKIKKYFDKHPHLFKDFPVICESYKRIVKLEE
ncbi:MAG: sigma-54 dependent transcriptional regulator [Saprospiraceae bacterium]|jgi:DNA-binding NtrC family response regulator|nr:sigma-54 dependent transcriptional regulator [Saprospiraceae bacterium]